ncbi:non-ribosomal peptide synthetase [Cellvibrio mixtus]|uniref:non-ribosomal peptide synthetase n=1 Tax=Cellvibrio mixtus TaxID=39650 RepID=UPI000587D96E|nr:non-ribosomal peptide synthetase [Cellvibrio mixtus]
MENNYSSCKHQFEDIELTSLVDIARHWAEVKPDHVAYRFLTNEGLVSTSITYGELDSKAKSIASRLQQANAHSQALLIFPPGLEFIEAFWGCLYAGVVCVPVYPPRARAEDWIRLKAIKDNCQAEFILIGKNELQITKSLLVQKVLANEESIIDISEVLSDKKILWAKPDFQLKQLAFLQYTSGSTGSPKGVMVSHENLLHNQSMIFSSFNHTRNSVVAGWLPQYHDMGLIGNILHPMYLGTTAILMSPVTFLRRPITWLEMISNYKATTSGAPNFAYDLCVSRITEEEKEHLDLSSWDLAFNGAEPVNSTTLERFFNAFKICGFKYNAFYPCYGMAESTLMISGVNKADQPVALNLERENLDFHIIKTSASNESSVSLVSCGQAGIDTAIRIVDPKTLRECENNKVGEIWVKGPSVALGYWGNPDLTAASFNAHINNSTDPNETFLRTGDMGFLHDKQLYVSGRLKDLIIVRGKNYYPQDIETTAQNSSKHLRAGRGACFSVETKEKQKIILIQEMERSSVRKAEGANVETLIREAVLLSHGLYLDEIILVKPGKIFITSSGKVRRSECRLAYLKGVFATAHEEDAKQKIKEEYSAATSGDNDNYAYVKSLFLNELNIDVDNVSWNVSIVNFGVDSLKAAHLQYRIEADKGVAYDMSRLLSGPTLLELMTHISELESIKDKNNTASLLVSASSVANDNISHQQMGFWYLQNLHPDSANYNLSLTLKLSSSENQRDINVEHFRESVRQLIEEQEILRSVYIEKNGVPFQIVKSDFLIEDYFRFLDASLWNANQLDVELKANILKPINLQYDPVIRIYLYKVADNNYVLNVVIHHIAADAWSVQLLIKKIANYYQAYQSSIKKHLQKINQYSVFSQKNAALINSAHVVEMQSFWRDYMAGAGSLTELPIDHPRGTTLDFSGDNFDFYLSRDQFEKVERTLLETNSTLYMFLLSVYQVLLYRFMGEQDIIVGSPISERPLKFAETVGCFVDIKPIRSQVNGNDSFKVHLDKLKNTFIHVIKNKSYPLQLIIRDTFTNDSLAAGMTFPNVRFSLQQESLLKGSAPFYFGAADSSLTLDSFSLSSYQSNGLKTDLAQAELSLTAVECDAGILFRFNYNKCLFEQKTISRLADCYKAILASAVSNLTQKICDIPLPPTIPLSLIKGNQNALSALPRHFGIHQVFERQVKMVPNATAVVCGIDSLTYEELNRKANCLAHALVDNGVLPETRVAIYCKRSVDTIIAFFGALKAGACCILLEPSVTKKRCEYIIDDAEVKVILGEEASELSYSDNIVFLSIKNSLSRYADKVKNLSVNIIGSNAAYIIYTSGSTGEPKGVVGIHEGIINRTEWMLSEYGINAEDTVLHATPINFVRAEREIFFPLCAGAKLVILDENGLENPVAFLNALNSENVTFTASSPAHLRIMLDTDAAKFASISSIKHWFIGADVLHHSLIKRIQHFQPNVQFSYFYGSTETTSDVACFRVPYGYEKNEFTTPIGSALSNTIIYILDENLSQVPVGGIGEIYIEGMQLSRGYNKSPRLTAEKFIPNPFSKVPGSRLYRMGDLARQLPDGNIIIAGRKDSQININGFRIEPAEIEKALCDLSSIKSAVISTYFNKGDLHLIAYVVTYPWFNKSLDEAQLREELKLKLPAYMIPSAFVYLDELPLTTLGKIERRLLPSPVDAISQAFEASYVAPENELEVMLVEIWESVLGDRNLAGRMIGTNDDFFQIGGNSLLGTKLLSIIKSDLGIDISIRELFNNPKISLLANKILIMATELEELQ